MRGIDLRVALSSPYREAALMAIRSAAAAHQVLGWTFTSTIGRPPATEEVLPLAVAGEVLRVAAGRLGDRTAALAGMRVQKRLFDRAVAAHLPDDATVVVAMPGAAVQTFARGRECLKVLHQVDAHPEVHNERLLDHYPRQVAAAELYPPSFVRRVRDEIDLASIVLCPSREVERQFRAHGVPEARLRRVPYGVDMVSFRPLRGRRGAGAGRRPTVVYVGQISLRKGIPFLLQAVRDLPLNVVLIGNVFDRRLVASLPENVRLGGRVSHSALPQALADADALVLPTVEDACALVVAEAAACGLQVITTSANGAAELLGPTSQIVPPGDVPALRSALRSVQPLGLRDRLARRAQVEVGHRIDNWGRYGDRVLETLADELRGRHPEPMSTGDGVGRPLSARHPVARPLGRLQRRLV